MFLANKIKRQINTPKYKQSVECIIWPVSYVLYEEIVWPGEKIMTSWGGAVPGSVLAGAS